jgi:hypothetical protein
MGRISASVALARRQPDGRGANTLTAVDRVLELPRTVPDGHKRRSLQSDQGFWSDHGMALSFGFVLDCIGFPKSPSGGFSN